MAIRRVLLHKLFADRAAVDPPQTIGRTRTRVDPSERPTMTGNPGLLLWLGGNTTAAGISGGVTRSILRGSFGRLIAQD
jgi:hypothetical protein